MMVAGSECREAGVEPVGGGNAESGNETGQPAASESAPKAEKEDGAR